MTAKKPPLAKAPQRPKIKVASSEFIEIKVTLNEVEPPVWRKFIISTDANLKELHMVIQKTMGWQNSHLHDFSINNGKQRFSPKDMSESFDNDDESEDSSEVTIADLMMMKIEDFQYNYDYGDGWEHSIEIGKEVLPQAGVKYPLCTEGSGACPPEDCGGPYGYLNLCKILSNPKDEEYKEMREWVGREFDPTKFSIEKANKELRSKSW
jgi:hypothetical protein